MRKKKVKDIHKSPEILETKYCIMQRVFITNLFEEIPEKTIRH